jgi:PAS domain S-box-containing protein
LLWLHALSALLIAVASTAIAVCLVIIVVRRRDLAFRPAFGLGAAVMLMGGVTGLLYLLTLWTPLYWPEATAQAATAALAVAAAITTCKLVPTALSMPSLAQLRQLNARLEAQVAEHDISALRYSESKQRLRRLYARTPAALHATDHDGTLLAVSDRWLELFGYQRQDVLGRHICDFYVPEEGAIGDDDLAALQAKGGSHRAERRIWRGDGEIRDVEATYELEHDDQGRLERILVALADITPRKRAEAALRASEERLRQSQKMEAVGQLTGGIAHDFNNLLTTVMGSLEMLTRQPGLDARGQRLANNALAGAQRAARLTSQLLSFSRRQRLSPEPLAPAEVVAGIRDLLRRTAGDQVRFELPPPNAAQWHVLADRNQLEVALLNLVINARDAIADTSTAPGRIALRFANYNFCQADVEALGQEQMPPGDYVGIAVLDSGHGMTAEVAARAFEPFFTTKPTGAGTGLGLSQTYGFATQSGGTVRIDSTQGVGTTVELLLPRARAAAHGKNVPEAASRTNGRGETVLLVEDDTLLRNTVAEGLRQRGYKVIEAQDGSAALATLNRGATVDFLFTDIMMPGDLNGVAVARAARTLRANLKIMFATGYSDREVLAEWPEALDLVQKPYSLDTLVTRISTRLHEAEVAS